MRLVAFIKAYPLVIIVHQFNKIGGVLLTFNGINVHFILNSLPAIPAIFRRNLEGYLL